MVNTERGQNLINSIDAAKHEARYQDVVCYNPSLLHSPKTPANRVKFFTELPKHGMLRTTRRSHVSHSYNRAEMPFTKR